jgi:hypothetical protein
MAGIAVAEGKPAKKGPKVLSHLEIRPQLGGGHIVKHVYEGYQHEPRPYSFEEGEGQRALAHIARHTGLSEHLNGGAEEEPSETEEEIAAKPVKEHKTGRREA